VNVGTGIENRYPETFVYTNVELLDLPEQDITPGIMKDSTDVTDLMVFSFEFYH
jgi:hypothetical protein